MIYPHNANIDVAFYNDKVKEVIAASDIAEPFTYVPIRAQHMELVGGNAVVFGNLTEGYNPIPIEVRAEISYNNVVSDFTRSDFIVLKTYSEHFAYYQEPPPGGGDDPWEYWFRDFFIDITIPDAVRVNAWYYVTIKSTIYDMDITGSYECNLGDTAADIVNGLIASLLANGLVPGQIAIGTPNTHLYLLPGTSAFQIWPVDETISGEEFYKEYVVTAYVSDYGLANKHPNIKHGAIHEFGLIYKDELGRCCQVLTFSGLEVYLPFYSEPSGPNIGDLAVITFKIYNKPPSWATTYEIVYAGNISMNSFLQIRISDIGALADGYRFSLMVQDTLTWTRDQNNRWKVPDWIWEDGDRIRLIGTIDSGTGVITKYTTLYDYEIEETNNYDGTAIGGDWLIIQAIDHPATFEGQHDIIAEIYRPLLGLDVTAYYGTGMVFNVIEDDVGNKYHEGNINQTINAVGNVLTPAEIYNTANDSWMYQRLNFVYNSTVIWPFFAESNAPSDWWKNQTKLTNRGWPYLFSDVPLNQVVITSRLRHGGYLIIGSQINNIAHFTYNQFVDLPRKNGDITGIREIGYTLKILQKIKETSIYIQRIEQFSPDGTSQFTLINELLGTQRPEATDYGCQHPESVLVNDRNLYYWDNSEGKVIRSAPNGQLEISDIKMKRWFKDLLLWINANGGRSKLNVHTGFNVEHNELWVNFSINGLITGAIFSEKDGRWITRIDQRTESYVHIGNWFAHVYKQRLYIMNLDEGQKWLSWAGVDTVGEVQFPSNIYPGKNKIFNAIAVYADHQFSCLSRYITIPDEASLVLMETYIATWDRREGIYYGKILKDQNSPGNFVSENDMTMNGREMRGRYCYIRLQTIEHDEKVRLNSVFIFSTGSERSG